MRELVFEIQLSGRHLPKEVLDHSQVLHLLRFDTDGYLMICKMSKEVWLERKKTFPAGGSRKLVIKAIGEQGKDSVLLEVSGLWLGEEEKRAPDRMRAFEFFKSLEKLPLYQLKPPTIQGNAIRIFAIAENSEIRQLLDGLKTAGLSFKVVKLYRFEGRTDSR